MRIKILDKQENMDIGYFYPNLKIQIVQGGGQRLVLKTYFSIQHAAICKAKRRNWLLICGFSWSSFRMYFVNFCRLFVISGVKNRS